MQQQQQQQRQQSSNDNSPTDESPTNPESAVILQQQCPSTAQMSPANLPDDIQATLALTPLVPTPQEGLKLDLRPTSQNMELNKFGSPSVTDNNQCMIDTSGNLNPLAAAIRAKNQCLLDSMSSLNQTVSSIGHSLRGISPNMEVATEVISDASPKRDIFVMASLNTKNDDSPSDSVFSTLTKTSTDESTTTESSIDFQESSSPTISSYSNELNEIFNDYFMSRGKELEIYESKERQNIVCMNKCIDVFRKIMMEKIN